MKVNVTFTKKELLDILVKYLIYTKGLTYSNFKCSGDIDVEDIIDSTLYESNYSITLDLSKE